MHGPEARARRSPPLSMPPEQKTRRLGFAVSAVVTAASVALAARRLDFPAVRHALAEARLLPWLPAAVSVCILGYVLRGLRCKRILSRQANVGRTAATNVVVVGYAFNNVLPLRLGEVVRVVLLSRRGGIPLVQSLAVTFLERLFDGLTLLFFFALATALLPAAPWARAMAKTAAIVFGSALTFALAMRPRFVFAVLARLAALFGGNVRERVLRFAMDATSGVEILRRPRDLGVVLLLSLAVWACEIGMFALLLPAFGLPLRPTWAMFVQPVTNFGILLPSSPGYIGPWHTFGMRALGELGVPHAVGLSYATLVHLTFFIPITAWGVAAMSAYAVDLGAKRSLARKARAQEEVTYLEGVPVRLVASIEPDDVSVSTRQSALLRALVDALLPDIGELSREERDSAVFRTTAFVEAQIADLPARLRTLFGIGMLGFRILVRLFTLHGYCDLPRERRVAIANAWAYGRFALPRQLFRVLRSTAMVAFFDNPVVAAKVTGEARGDRRVLEMFATRAS